MLRRSHSWYFVVRNLNRPRIAVLGYSALSFHRLVIPCIWLWERGYKCTNTPSSDATCWGRTVRWRGPLQGEELMVTSIHQHSYSWEDPFYPFWGVLVKKWITSILIATTRKTSYNYYLDAPSWVPEWTWVNQRELLGCTSAHRTWKFGYNFMEPGCSCNRCPERCHNKQTQQSLENAKSKCCPEVDQQWLNQIWEIQVFLGTWSTR